MLKNQSASGGYDTERDAHPDTVKLFEEIRARKYQAFTSMYAVGELERAPSEKYQKMMRLITEYSITVLQESAEVNTLAAKYQEQGILPARSTTDARHIVCATVNDIDMILSLNFEHIVRKKTVLMTGTLNAQHGYRAVEIHSPMEVVDRENS